MFNANDFKIHKDFLFILLCDLRDSAVKKVYFLKCE